MKQENLKGLWHDWYEAAATELDDAGTIVSKAASQMQQSDAILKYCFDSDPKLLNDISIIEIGPGNGILAKTLMDNFKISRYVVVDGQHQLNNVDKNLSNHIDQIELYTPEQIPEITGNFDLFISCHCLPETPKEYQLFIYKTFFPRSSVLMIEQTRSALYGDPDLGHVESGPDEAQLIKALDTHFTTNKNWFCNEEFPNMNQRDHQRLYIAK